MTNEKGLFEAVERGDTDLVRSLLAENKDFTLAKHKSDTYKFDQEVENDAYKFLGAYLGQLTALQLAILKGHDRIAKDIVDATVDTETLNIPCGGGNTALHLATFLGSKDVVKRLVERGADQNVKNSKGFTSKDINMTGENLFN